MEQLVPATALETFRKRCKNVIDVRSPAEFAEDHMAGARNIPMLTDAQRAEIGALHRQNPFQARKKGAGYVVAAISRFLETPLMRQATRQEGFLVYCARGGQRSGALSTVLSQIGLPVFRLEKGYKTYRTYVSGLLQQALPQPVFVLYGYTGSQKTKLLQRLADRCNVLDLEACARHRGSLLGELPGIAQPIQRAFETALVENLRGFDPQRPTLVEGESRRIGAREVPRGIWRQMKLAQPIWLNIPRETRTRTILVDYAELCDSAFLLPRLERLSPYISAKLRAELRDLASSGQWHQLVHLLLTHHYDPLYEKIRKRHKMKEIHADDPELGLQELAAFIQDAQHHVG